MDNNNFYFRFAIESLLSKKTDVIYGFAIESYTLFNVVEYTLFHVADDSRFWVPRASLIPNWQHIGKIFKNNIWLLIIITLFLNSFLWFMCGKITNETIIHYRSLYLTILGSYKVLLQGSISQPKHILNRIVFIIWTLTSLLLFTAYQSQLISILTKPLYEHQISNVGELLQTDLIIGYVPTFYYNQLNLSKMQNSQLQISQCPLNELCLNRTAFQKDMAAIKGVKFTKYYMLKYFTDLNGKELLVDLKDSSIPLLPKYCFRRGFPLLEKISNICLLLHSNGLIDKWEKELFQSYYLVNNEYFQKPLTTEHLQGAFYLLLFGEIISILVFFLENIYVTIRIP